jgi:phospholipase/carboxylesterase
MYTPQISGPHPLILLLHGWTGDEKSMWIFASRLPEDAILLAPRGLYHSAMGGYSWQESHAQGWPNLDDFLPAIQALTRVLTHHNFPSAKLGQVSLLGFSQGAALAYSFALVHPERISSFAGLSGFMPERADSFISRRPLEGKPVFVAHGSQDKLVPLTRARKSVILLKQAGAQVIYCEHDVGHKLNAACFLSLQLFYKKDYRINFPNS